MNARILEIPSEPADIADWLARELVGPGLPQLARELQTIHGGTTTTATDEELYQWLGGDKAILLEQGLTAVSTDKQKQLLGRPELLVPLQELILIEGGQIWERLLAAEPDVASASQRVKKKLQLHNPLFAAGNSGSTDIQRPSSLPPHINWRYLWTAVAVAASILVLSLWIPQGNPPLPQPTWGWHGPDLLSQKLPPAEYLQTLAKAGDAWFNKRPDSTVTLKQRIVEMRSGCDRLIVAEHPQLPPVERDWLREKCKLWRDKFDAQLAALDKGTAREKVQAEMDDIVKKLVTALNSRAEEYKMRAGISARQPESPAGYFPGNAVARIKRSPTGMTG
ncbi:MAG: hypothetical protein SFX18_02470 [Pirellulales bacterium]|nr:hypothetical protein [Pirellulales bacterium]